MCFFDEGLIFLRVDRVILMINAEKKNKVASQIIESQLVYSTNQYHITVDYLYCIPEFPNFREYLDQHNLARNGFLAFRLKMQGS